MAPTAFKLKPRFQSRLARKFLSIFLALLLISVLSTAGFLVWYSILFLPTQGVPPDALQPFLISQVFQALGILAISLVLSGLIFALFVRSLVKKLVEIKESLRLFTEGVWTERIPINRNDELGLLAHQFNLLAEELTSVYSAVEKKVQEVSGEVQVIAEISKLAASAVSKIELLQAAVRLMVEHFGYHEASVYLLDDSGQYLVLVESYGNPEIRELLGKVKFRIGSQTIIGWVGENHIPETVGDVGEFYSFKRTGLLPDTLSETAVPVLLGGRLSGVINVQSKKAYKFEEEQVASLQILANLLAISLRQIDLQACTDVNIEEAALLFNLSQKISKSESIEEIFQAVEEGLGKTDYYSILLSACDHSLEIVSIQNPDMPEATNISNWPLIGLEGIEELMPTGNPIIISNLDDPPKMPGLLLYLLREWQTKSSAFIPITSGGRLSALFILATREREILSPTLIQPFANLAELIGIAIKNIEANQTAEKRRTEIQALQVIGEAIAGQTTMFAIYTAVHKAIQNLIGDVNFLIALYDKDTNLIQIPYLFEGSEVLDVDPFPLGEGLTSILIRTQQPLLLVHDTEKRAVELGAKIVGALPKSWLGAPMSLRGEVVGALIVQDLEKEGRFSQDDQQLLLTVGAQIGSAVQTARLVEQTTRQAAREKQLHEITRKIRRSTDMRTILATTASEIGKSLEVYRTSLEILPQENGPADDSQRDHMDLDSMSSPIGDDDK